LYARTARAVVRRPSFGVAILVGSMMHAAGHALVAAAGGMLARSLAGGGGSMDQRSMRIAGELGAGDAMLGLAFVGLAAALVKLAGGVLAAGAEARVAGDVGTALRLEVLDRVLAANSVRAARHADHGSAELAHAGTPERAARTTASIASLTTHVADVERGVAAGVLGELRSILQLAPLAVLLAVLAPTLAGSAALALGGFGALVLLTRRALKRGFARAARETEDLLGAADEAVRHADLWRTYGAEHRVRAHLLTVSRRIVETGASLRARAALLSATSEVLGALALVLVVALVSAGAIGGVDRGAIVPFAIAFFMAYKPLRELVDARLARARADEAIRAAGASTETTSVPAPLASTGVAAASDASPPARTWPLAPLSIEGLVTRNGAHAPVSLRLRPGEIAAIVGATGVGKTSLLRALLGLDDALAGAVRYGDRDLTACGVGPSERPFAWVPQDAPVLGDTLVANVVLADAREGGEEAERDETAARVLGELGAEALAASVGQAVLATDRKVSGGERQWINVARALATRLPVLLLDEPTSSLDPEAQTRMLRVLEGLRGKRTVLLVTHRPEPLAIADVVVRLHGSNAQHGAGSDGDARGVEELAVEDVGAVALREAERGRARERVDVGAAE